MILSNLKTDIVEYIFKIRTNEIERDLLKLELLSEILKLSLLKFLIKTKKYLIIRYDNESLDYKIKFKNINYNPGLQDIMMLYDVFLNENIVIVHILNDKIFHKSEILKNPLLIEIITIISDIYEKLLKNETYDIYVNGIIKIYEKNNINYYIIDYNWEYYHMCKINNIDEDITLELDKIRELCFEYNTGYKNINLENLI
tara:strand:+ start:10760 stop:11359 length:600 start_codon:yes stop_codon:yes gene_type:complete